MSLENCRNAETLIPDVSCSDGDPGVDAVYYAFDNTDAAPYGFSSEAVYQALRLPLVPPPLPFTRLDTGITAEQLLGE